MASQDRPSGAVTAPRRNKFDKAPPCAVTAPGRPNKSNSRVGKAKVSVPVEGQIDFLPQKQASSERISPQVNQSRVSVIEDISDVECESKQPFHNVVQTDDECKPPVVQRAGHVALADTKASSLTPTLVPGDHHEHARNSDPIEDFSPPAGHKPCQQLCKRTCDHNFVSPSKHERDADRSDKNKFEIVDHNDHPKDGDSTSACAGQAFPKEMTQLVSEGLLRDSVKKLRATSAAPAIPNHENQAI